MIKAEVIRRFSDALKGGDEGEGSGKSSGEGEGGGE